MRAFILSLPGKLQPVFVIGSILTLAFLSAFICSLFFDIHQLTANIDLISSVYEVSGTIYAILLTFTLWGVWQNFTDAGKSVQNEAYALLDLVHMLEASSGKKNSAVREAALSYSQAVIEKEWPTLKDSNSDLVNLRQCNHNVTMKVLQAVQQINPQNERETVILDQTLSLLVRWLDARRTRLLIARGGSVKALWPLLFTGAFVLFAFNGLFVAQTPGIWLTLLFGTALIISVTFYLIFSLDCPFAGSLSIDSEPFAVTIDLLKSGSMEISQ